MNPETTAGSRGVAGVRSETMTTGEVADYLGLASRASACGWLRRHGIYAVSRQPGSRGQNLYPAELVKSSERRGYDRWRDVEDTPIPTGCRVQQIGVHRPHGGTRARLGQHAVVIERRCSRVYLRFDGEQRIVSIRPYLVRVAPVTGAAHGGEEDPRPFRALPAAGRAGPARQEPGRMTPGPGEKRTSGVRPSVACPRTPVPPGGPGPGSQSQQIPQEEDAVMTWYVRSAAPADAHHGQLHHDGTVSARLAAYLLPMAVFTPHAPAGRRLRGFVPPPAPGGQPVPERRGRDEPPDQG